MKRFWEAATGLLEALTSLVKALTEEIEEKG